MNEYGGYIQLDTYPQNCYYPDLLPLNSGRACLRFLIRARAPKLLYLPYFCCSSVAEACQAEGIPYEYYQVDEQFCPILTRPPEEGCGLYVVNAYGQLPDHTIDKLSRQWPLLIADYTHAFFQPPRPHVDTLYSCRKFFGVADGAYLWMAGQVDSARFEALDTDISHARMGFLLGRYEAAAADFYPDYVKNNDLMADEPVKKMSRLTQNLLSPIDYRMVKKQRSVNYLFLHEKLKHHNRLNPITAAGAYAYPLWLSAPGRTAAEIRKQLAAQKIYIPLLWPEVLATAPKDSADYALAEHILPLPVDQRYTQKDMEVILHALEPYF